MKAWRIYAPGDMRKDELPAQSVGSECVKIKILKTAVTHSDNYIFEGKKQARFPLTLGRHCVAMVTEVGEDVKTFTRGNKVVLSPYAVCHDCDECNSGREENCERKLEYGVTEEGFFRDFAVVGANDLYGLPERVDDGEAMFLEHIATAVGIINRLALQKGEHIAIVGATVTGIILAQVAMYYQAVPVLLDLRRDRLDIAASLGVYYTVDTTESDAFKKVFSLTGGRMAEACAFMSPETMPLTRVFDFCRSKGRIAVGEFGDGGLNVDLAAAMKKQLTVFCTGGMGKNMASAINMLANKTVKVAPLISKVIGFDDLPSTLSEMKELPDKYIKVVVDMTGGQPF